MQRSKISQLPEDVREEFEQLLIASGFADYTKWTEWLNEKGFEVSRSSVARDGQKLQRRLNAIRVATDGARAIAKASPDDEGLMAAATIRLLQEKIFTLMVGMEEIDAADVDIAKLGRMIADLSRAAISQKKWQGEVVHMKDLPNNVDRPALFLESLKFIVGVLKENDPEGLKTIDRNFDAIVNRFKGQYAKAS